MEQYRKRVGEPNPRPTSHIWAVGDRVAFSRAFMKNTGMIDHDTARARGTIIHVAAVGDQDIASIRWDTTNLVTNVNVLNLSLIRSDGVIQDRD